MLFEKVLIKEEIISEIKILKGIKTLKKIRTLPLLALNFFAWPLLVSLSCFLI